MDGGAWQATVHGVAKSQTRLSEFTVTFHFPALEKEMATHSSVLAWRIPGQGSPVGCRLWGRTELDTTEAIQQQQQQHLFLAVLGLRCCVGFSLAVTSGGYPLPVLCRLLTAVASLVAENGLQRARASAVVARGPSSCSSQALEHGLNSCGAWAQLPPSMWDLLGSRIKPLSPELAYSFFTTEP